VLTVLLNARKTRTEWQRMCGFRLSAFAEGFGGPAV